MKVQSGLDLSSDREVVLGFQRYKTLPFKKLGLLGLCRLKDILDMSHSVEDFRCYIYGTEIPISRSNFSGKVTRKSNTGILDT